MNSDFSQDTTESIKLLNVISGYTEIWSEEKSFNAPKHVEIRLYGWMWNWD